VYQFLLQKTKILPIKHQTKWCDVLQLDTSAVNWSKVYENNYFATLETKLRSFQIRLNTRSIVTNIQLHGFEIIERNLCLFCSKSPENLLHLFCDCAIVEKFWNDVSDRIAAKYRINFRSNKFHKLFGFQDNSTFYQFINELLLCARFLIYRCKHSNAHPEMIQYFNMINIVRKTEYIIAKERNKLNLHYEKWRALI